MHLLGRLTLGALALVLAIPCGAAVLTVALLLDPVGGEVLSRLGLAGLLSGLTDLADGLPPDVAVAAALAVARAILVLLVLPPVAAAASGEILGLRAPAWYGGASGALTALLPWLARADARPRAGLLAAEGRITALLFLAGAVSGLVYWLVAGRGAGSARSR